MINSYAERVERRLRDDEPPTIRASVFPLHASSSSLKGLTRLVLNCAHDRVCGDALLPVFVCVKRSCRPMKVDHTVDSMASGAASSTKPASISHCFVTIVMPRISSLCCAAATLPPASRTLRLALVSRAERCRTA